MKQQTEGVAATGQYGLIYGALYVKIYFIKVQ